MVVAPAGLAGAWIGLTVQHCGNHGAMSTSPAVNKAMGLTDDLIGGSSLMWRYHHQASPLYLTLAMMLTHMQTIYFLHLAASYQKHLFEHSRSEQCWVCLSN